MRLEPKRQSREDKQYNATIEIEVNEKQAQKNMPFVYNTFKSNTFTKKNKFL